MTKEKTFLLVELWLVLFICCNVLIVYNVSVFWIGFHNFDLGHNINTMNHATMSEFEDYVTKEKTVHAIDLIIMGHNQIVKSFYINIIAVLMWVCSFIILLEYITRYRMEVLELWQ